MKERQVARRRRWARRGQREDEDGVALWARPLAAAGGVRGFTGHAHCECGRVPEGDQLVGKGDLVLAISDLQFSPQV